MVDIMTACRLASEIPYLKKAPDASTTAKFVSVFEVLDDLKPLLEKYVNVLNIQTKHIALLEKKLSSLEEQLRRNP
jgi:hypothetical protein